MKPMKKPLENIVRKGDDAGDQYFQRVEYTGIYCQPLPKQQEIDWFKYLSIRRK